MIIGFGVESSGWEEVPERIRTNTEPLAPFGTRELVLDSNSIGASPGLVGYHQFKKPRSATQMFWDSSLPRARLAVVLLPVPSPSAPLAHCTTHNMAINWTPKNDQTLLLKIIETHPDRFISIDADEIIKTWRMSSGHASGWYVSLIRIAKGHGYGRPTAQLLIEHIEHIKRMHPGHPKAPDHSKASGHPKTPEKPTPKRSPTTLSIVPRTPTRIGKPRRMRSALNIVPSREPAVELQEFLQDYSSPDPISTLATTQSPIERRQFVDLAAAMPSSESCHDVHPFSATPSQPSFFRAVRPSFTYPGPFASFQQLPAAVQELPTILPSESVIPNHIWHSGLAEPELESLYPLLASTFPPPVLEESIFYSPCKWKCIRVCLLCLAS
ncbi:hypothetical protein K440DRAFT_645583 [Wilcoxina mikolae CBS 423.85]|nr:hypothetical protein K440DRAFT_645583 [Wilcoxina mikolae CBS 423.85]